MNNHLFFMDQNVIDYFIKGMGSKVIKSQFWLIIALVGAVIPYYFFTQQFAETGLNLIAFLNALFASGASGGFASDLLITSFVFWIWIITEIGRLGTGQVVLLILINLFIGLSCALPLYFYLKTRTELTGNEA